MSGKNSEVKTVSIVMIIMFVGKVVGLLRSSAIAGYLGIFSLEADAFTQASKIPRDFLDIAFASAISSSFIPIFNSYIEKKGRKEAFRLADNFITIIFILSVAITLIAMVFSSQIVNILAYGFEPDKKLLTVKLLVIMLPTIAITALAFSVTGILQSLNEFNIPAAMSVVSNVIIILYIVFFMDKFGVTGLAIAFLIGWSSQLLIQIPPLLKKEYSYRPYLNLKDEGIKQIGALSIPVMISSWVFPINSQVNASAVSIIGGGATALDKANELYMVITGVLILSVANVIFPKLSRDSVRGGEREFGDTMRRTLRVLFFLLTPMTVGLIVLREPAIGLVYEGDSFTPVATTLTANAMMFYCTGMLGFGLLTILSRGFYASKDGLTPLLTSLAAIAVNAVLSFTLVNTMGIGGPPLASSVSVSIAALIMLVVMYKKNKTILDIRVGIDFIKIIIISISLGVIVNFLMMFMGGLAGGFIGRAIILSVCVTVGILWYVIIAYFAKIEEARFIFGFMRNIPKKFSQQR